MTEREMAAVLLAYANGAQIQAHRIREFGCWLDVSEPQWDFYDWEYRVKAPRTIDDIEPMREAPVIDTPYFVPIVDGRLLTVSFPWGDTEQGYIRLRRGLCYATREDAEIAARAMIALKGGEV